LKISNLKIEHISAFLLGLSIFYFYPIIGDIKPFDILAGLFILINIRHGIRFLKYDLLFALFIASAILSLAFAQATVFDSSLLQTLRYLIYFIAARIVLTNSTMDFLISGIKYSFIFSFLYIMIDIIYYYSVGECKTISYMIIPTDESRLTTHRSGYVPLFGACGYFRPSGFSWDPGGLYPLMVVVGALYLKVFNTKKYFHYSGLFGMIAISRTAFMTYVIGLIALKSRAIALFVSVSLFIVLPVLALILINENYLILDEGTKRHLTYPALAFEAVLSNPVYYFSGEGIRGAANVLLLSDSLPSFMTKPDSDVSTLVVESIWLNILMGTGLIGFISYMSWMILGYKDVLIVFATIFIAGTFYTFDSSQYCFLVPFMMRVIKDRI